MTHQFLFNLYARIIMKCNNNDISTYVRRNWRVILKVIAFFNQQQFLFYIIIISLLINKFGGKRKASG